MWKLAVLLLGMLGAPLISAATPQADARDGELMARIAQGDERAFSTLYDRYSRAVFSTVLRVVRDRAMAEDLLQEVFLTCWRSASRYDQRAESVLPWLLVIGRNRALDRIRSAQHRNEQAANPLEEVADLASARESFEETIWKHRTLDQVREALQSLGKDERRVLELAYFEGLSQTEISASTGHPLGTVKSWTRSGLQKLRRALL